MEQALRPTRTHIMGYERNTYYFDRLGEMTFDRSSDSVLEVSSVEHDVYGNPTYSASVLDVTGAKEALPILRLKRPWKECRAIADAINRSKSGGPTDSP